MAAAVLLQASVHASLVLLQASVQILGFGGGLVHSFGVELALVESEQKALKRLQLSLLPCSISAAGLQQLRPIKLQGRDTGPQSEHMKSEVLCDLKMSIRREYTDKNGECYLTSGEIVTTPLAMTLSLLPSPSLVP